MVIRAEQCGKFEEAIPNIIIIPENPQFDPFHQFKIGGEWRVERRNWDPTATQITWSLYVTNIGNMDVVG